eukprot:SAG22_NODE_2586_length_2411_cov_2.865052_1_plen_351_part_00
MPGTSELALMDLQWTKHAANPVLPTVAGSAFDSTSCMNPFAMLDPDGDTVRLFYAGADDDAHRRICLATASLSAGLTEWRRLGPLFERGDEGRFDHNWCVLPCVHRFGQRWHLYYSGNEGSTGTGLQGFPGIGLATSDDGVHFTKYSDDPVITGDQTREFPTNRGIAGGGTILEEAGGGPDGSVRYRMYYTLAVGTPDTDIRIDQEKHCAVCFSTDGIVFTDHRIVMSPRPDVPREDAAVAAPYVWREEDSGLYRMIYSPIGTQFGFYSLAQAVSCDGLVWHRGAGDENVALVPDSTNLSSWERQMVEYPSVLRLDSGSELLMFYCGNGYGATGVGVARARGKRRRAPAL